MYTNNQNANRNKIDFCDLDMMRKQEYIMEKELLMNTEYMLSDTIPITFKEKNHLR